MVLSRSMTSVVVATPDVVGDRMAGPGIRAYHLAHEMAKAFPTTLVAEFQDFHLERTGFEVVQRGTRRAARALRRADVVVGQPFRDLVNRMHGKQKLVFDLFDPVVLELPELAPYRSRVRHAIHLRREWGRLLFALRYGDLLICASGRQRDFYTGVAAASDPKRIVAADRWIEIPFGVEEDPPPETIELPDGDDRPLVVWGGGVWPWLDPEMAIQAVTGLNASGVPCRLLFMGMMRPNLASGQLGRAEELRRLAAESDGLVIWNENWVRYRERHQWLNASKVAIMLHRRTVEAEFSVRTRMFDALWCTLPVITSEGGLAADLVEREHLGVVVEPENLESVMAGLRRLLTDDAYHARSVFNLERLRPRYRWEVITSPLINAIRQWSEPS
ncbi:MAG TPA: glycosyltransferase family 4 protein [Thermoanaerobaculia bacterium]|nr:glycosyltransferase family 4 protein [Thermoanaerobaculia bacterium]